MPDLSGGDLGEVGDVGLILGVVDAVADPELVPQTTRPDRTLAPALQPPLPHCQVVLLAMLDPRKLPLLLGHRDAAQRYSRESRQ
ncbi:hypothetical protein [Nocardia sp. NPDC005998]|uniref:hypothetical protein n=1 Tax=Nocardia sp. NPDC005998 TaxID=3156894 RepID=UPI0033ACB8EA